MNETVFNAYLEHEGQIVRFEVTDQPLMTGVSINKTGPKEAMPGQPVNYRFDHIGNTSNVRLDSFYWRDTIPAQLRLQTVVTGTYNFPGSYKITYRVNGGEPRTLADNLSTSRNYTLDASPTALGLASNEYVSEIMFVFGQAPAGFSQVEAPDPDSQRVGQFLRQCSGRGRRVQRTVGAGRDALDHHRLPQARQTAQDRVLSRGTPGCGTTGK